MSSEPVIERIAIRARGVTFPALAAGSGPLVLCLHGFPDCLRSFRFQLPALARAGFRAVAPALRGYAPSCLGTPADTHALGAADDALAMLDALGVRDGHLVGHDWGAVAAYLAAARAPLRFRSITTLSVPHPLGMVLNLHRVPGQVWRSWYILLFQVPGLAELLLRARDFALIDRLFRTWSPGYQPEPAELSAIKDVFREKGVVRAALTYYRSLLRLHTMVSKESRALLARPISPPLLSLTGQRDGCIKTELHNYAMVPRWVAHGVVARLDGVGHFLHQEDPARVNAHLVAFLREIERDA